MNPTRTRAGRRPGPGRNAPGFGAFTIPEMMVVMAIFGMVFLAMVNCQLFGLRLERISETKLAATAGGRKALNQLRNEVRSGKILLIGTGNDVTFASTPDNVPQAGNALQIHLTTNTTAFIRYYLDTSDSSLKRITSFGADPQVMASFITNQIVFRAEDFKGQILTNRQDNRVIGMTLEFYRWEYPIATVGHGSLYDYYRLQTRITRRMIE